MKNEIHHIDSKNEWLLLSSSFTAKFGFTFVLKQKLKTLFLTGYILKPTERLITSHIFFHSPVIRLKYFGVFLYMLKNYYLDIKCTSCHDLIFIKKLLLCRTITSIVNEFRMQKVNSSLNISAFSFAEDSMGSGGDNLYLSLPFLPTHNQTFICSFSSVASTFCY